MTAGARRDVEKIEEQLRRLEGDKEVFDLTEANLREKLSESEARAEALQRQVRWVVIGLVISWFKG